MGIRPHCIQVSVESQTDYYKIEGGITQLMGEVAYITAELQSKLITVEVPNPLIERIKNTFYIKFEEKDIHIFNKSNNLSVFTN